jgi:phosphohistidine phosphatase
MKTIYLNRHAKSSWSRPYSSDFERGLNKRGKINAEFMAKRFAIEVPYVTLISSPAVRALNTAKQFALALGIPEKDIIQNESIYGAGTSDMLRLIQELDDARNQVMLFGHNPTFTDLAYVLDHSFQDHMVTCARVKIECNVDSWSHVSSDIGTVIYHDYPRKYAEMENL